MHSLIEVDVDEVVELVGVACAEEEVGECDGFLGAGVGTAESAGRCSGEAEAAVIGVLTIDGVEVVDGGEDGLVFVADLVRAAPADQV